MMLIAYTLVCVAMLIAWGIKARRLRRQNLIARRGSLVPIGVLLLWTALNTDVAPLIGVGVALILIGEFLPDITVRAARHKSPRLGTFPRWSDAHEPGKPDFELHLEEAGARVQNVGGSTLFLHGWSPADQNGWLFLRAADGSGHPITVLKSGEWARLSPWPIPNRGVRVWYARTDLPDQQWLFRADWNDLSFGHTGRELN